MLTRKNRPLKSEPWEVPPVQSLRTQDSDTPPGLFLKNISTHSWCPGHHNIFCLLLSKINSPGPVDTWVTPPRLRMGNCPRWSPLHCWNPSEGANNGGNFRRPRGACSPLAITPRQASAKVLRPWIGPSRTNGRILHFAERVEGHHPGDLLPLDLCASPVERRQSVVLMGQKIPRPRPMPADHATPVMVRRETPRAPCWHCCRAFKKVRSVDHVHLARLRKSRTSSMSTTRQSGMFCTTTNLEDMDDTGQSRRTSLPWTVS